MRDAVVIGAGLAGLTAALRLAHGGAKVTRHEGNRRPSSTFAGHRRPSRILRLGSHHPAPRRGRKRISLQPDTLPRTSRPSSLPSSRLKEARPEAPRRRSRAAERRSILTSARRLRPTSLYQLSMAGIPAAGKSYVIVGLKRLKDFYPKVIAENSASDHGWDRPSRCAPSSSMLEIRKDEVDTTGTNHARAP